MSVEAFVISAMVEEGSIKKALQAGVSEADFELHDEEFTWLVARTEQKKAITPRLFRQKFPEFDFQTTREKLVDLLDELRRERMFISVNAAIDDIFNGEDALDRDNVFEKTLQFREIVDNILRSSGSHSDVLIKENWRDHYAKVKALFALRSNDEIPGIPTGITHLDHYWGGLQGQTAYLYLGRPGASKSFSLATLATEAAWHGYRAAVFSPEMSEHAHNCRFHTLLSAKPEVQHAVGLRGAFPNRSLMEGHGFNLKGYRKFLEWMESDLKGEIALFTTKYRRERMTVGYIDSRIENLGIDLVIVDPIYKLKSPRGRTSRWEELAEIVDGLTNLAHSHNIPVVMSNQANRALVGRREDAPSMDSSYGSDSPAHEADTVIGVKHYSDERVLKFRCSKNRYGEQFKFTARFEPNQGLIQDVTPLRPDHQGGYDPEKLDVLSGIIEKHV